MARPRRPNVLKRLGASLRAAAVTWSEFDHAQESPANFLRWRGGMGGESSTGVAVTDESALRIATVLSCVKVIAEQISTLPLMVFDRQGDGSKRAMPEHPLSMMLHTLPNLESTAQAVRETHVAHTLIRGDGYVRVVRDGGGRVAELWTLPPGTIEVSRPQRRGELLFRYSENGVPAEDLSAEDLWRLPGLSWNGVTGLSPIGLARESMGLAIALERSTAKTLKNSARLATVIEYDQEMDDPDFEAFKRDWKESAEGPDNAGSTQFLDRGMKLKTVGMSFEDLQFLELKRFQVAEICRLYRVPKHMVFEGDAMPRANMEQASLEFVIYTLRPWLVRVEQTITRDLLLPGERGRLFAEHNVAGLLRGDFQTRMAGYAQGRQWGWWSANDVRALENQNGIGPQGDVYLQPSNMVDAGNPQPPAQPVVPPKGA